MVLIESAEEVKEILFQLEHCPFFNISYPQQESCGSEICLRIAQGKMLAPMFGFSCLQFGRSCLKCFPSSGMTGRPPPPHVKTRESPPYLICVLTHCTHTISHFSAVASSLSVLPPRPGRPCCSHENIQHIPTHTLTNTYAHIKAILCRLIVIHCGYGNQMPFPSQFSSVVFLSLPNLCVQIPPTSTSHLWSSVPAILL